MLEMTPRVLPHAHVTPLLEWSVSRTIPFELVKRFMS